MNYNFGQQFKRTARTQSPFVAALILVCAIGTVNYASAQSVTPPATPVDITPRAGNSAFLVGHALGSQGYTCLPTKDGGTSWVINPARPEATLSADLPQPFQIITHCTHCHHQERLEALRKSVPKIALLGAPSPD